MADIESMIVLLLERTYGLIFQEASLFHGVHAQIQSMRFKFRKLQDSLKDAVAVQDEDETWKTWSNYVKDVVFSAEEAFDLFTFKASPLSQGRRFTVRIRKIALKFNKSIALYYFRSELKSINKRIPHVSSLVDGFISEAGAEQYASSETYEQLKPIEYKFSSLLAPEPDFVPLEEEFKILMEHLTEGDQRLSVVSLVGMSGLGKTTLAKKAYDNDAVKSHFDIRIWVYVSKRNAVAESDARLIELDLSGLSMYLFQTAFTEVCSRERDENSMLSISEIWWSSQQQRLQETLDQRLKCKRYLIVLDNVQDSAGFSHLVGSFPDDRNGSRVLITTSSRDISERSHVEVGRNRIIQLPYFGRYKSWQLFCKKVFSRPNDCRPSDLEEIGRRVLSKCRGMPFAVVIIGGLLSMKHPQEWEKINENIKWRWDEEDQFSDILSLCLKYLPYHLRPCFSYTCNFPVNYKLRAKKLIQLWVAEAILQPQGNQTEEEVGEEFLMELVQRSMLQIATKTSTCGIKTCCTHNLICKLGESEAPAFRNGGHLVLYNASTNSSSEILNFPFVRTFLYLNWLSSHQQAMSVSDCEQICKLKKLRVLDLEGAIISELPKEIGALIHLRYLGLRRTSVRQLPRSARNLRNLQTLDVKYTHINKIPDAIQGMPSLRHLHVNREIEFGNSELIESLKDLQTISMMHADAWMQKGLSTLEKLRKLGIKGDFSFCSNSLSGLRKLESLRVGLDFGNTSLNWESLPKNLAKLHLDRRIEMLPPANEFPQKLVKLCLRWSLLEEDQFSVLQSFQNLKVLLLGRGSFIGKKMVFSSGGFSQLEVLTLNQLNSLVEWRIEKEALRCLASLVIRCCRRLKELPEGLQHVLSTLKLLETELMTSEFISAAKRHPIIQQIPSFDIN